VKINQEWVTRFNSKWQEDKATGCWVWTASRTSKGYGQIKIPKTRRQIPAHRLSYLIHRGPIPLKKCVLHKCDNPPCVNPDHLFVGTKMDNALDMVSKMRHCYGERQGGHKLTEAEVLDIHRLIKMGMKQKEIARMFSIGEMQISRIKSGARWKHVFDRI
jgi:hypothetical protein